MFVELLTGRTRHFYKSHKTLTSLECTFTYQSVYRHFALIGTAGPTDDRLFAAIEEPAVKLVIRNQFYCLAVAGYEPPSLI